MSSPPFYIFKSPMVVMRSFDLMRRLINPFNRLWYSWYDSAYDIDKFMDGAVQAALLAALNLRERRFDKFREIATEQLMVYMRQRIPEMPADLLDQRLQFKRHHVVNGFHPHVSLCSPGCP
ncbi:hypothetical protein niasHT_001466 [Heterodera trifolii]|uniref:Uncharacterized protein n=1 Tax=Heterodera trifolii TaxID=157864 RepID=A0ABD2LSE0_9BILA